jgi:hypothetical protein
MVWEYAGPTTEVDVVHPRRSPPLMRFNALHGVFAPGQPQMSPFLYRLARAKNCRSASMDQFLSRPAQRKGPSMLYMLAVVLIALWLLGIVTSYTMSGFIHVLLVIAVVVVLIRLIQGRNVFGTKT